jgi:hypothetical protein
METKKSVANEYVKEIINRLKNQDDSWWSCILIDYRNRDWTIRIVRRFYHSGEFGIGLYRKYDHISSPSIWLSVEDYLIDENDVTAVRLIIQNKINNYKYH